MTTIAEPHQARPSQTMTATDALFWHMEAANARVRPIVGGLSILAGRPDRRLFEEAYRTLLELAPRLRQRVAEPALPFGFPTWVED